MIVQTFTLTGATSPPSSPAANVPGLVASDAGVLSLRLTSGPSDALVRIHSFIERYDLNGVVQSAAWLSGPALTLPVGGEPVGIGGIGGGAIYEDGSVFVAQSGAFLVERPLYPDGPIVCVKQFPPLPPKPVAGGGTSALFVAFESGAPGSYAFEVSRA